MSIITISRQVGSLGDEVAEALSSKLGWELITHDNLLPKFFAEVADSNELHMLSESAKYYLIQSKNHGTFIEYLKKSLKDFSEKQSAVLVGFGSQMIFAGNKDAIHIRITAPQSVRVTRIRKQYHVSETEASAILITADKKHRKFVSTIFDNDLTDISYYNMTLNTASISVDECVSSIIALLREHELQRSLEQSVEHEEVLNNMSDSPVFKNESETEFAKILDMYQIDWKYEPKTFPIEWDAQGNITSAFSPDFYLTMFDTYIELTTMNQKYVTAKNKKVKRLQELYPDINIKIIYKKDFYSLVERFNPTKGDLV